jgi:N-acetylmuramoyl-L-alanine amidase
MNNIYPTKSTSKSIFLTIPVSISIVGTSQPLNRLKSSIKPGAIDVEHEWNDSEYQRLTKNTIRSLLVETGRLINPANETYLASEAGKNKFASNIFEAVQAF